MAGEPRPTIGSTGHLTPKTIISRIAVTNPGILTKSTYSEAIQMDYVTMARAKGLSNLYITARHVLKNALIPVVTYFGPAIAFLITGSFVVESIFSIIFS